VTNTDTFLAGGTIDTSTASSIFSLPITISLTSTTTSGTCTGTMQGTFAADRAQSPIPAEETAELHGF
jgi:hypothetical protein